MSAPPDCSTAAPAELLALDAGLDDMLIIDWSAVEADQLIAAAAQLSAVAAKLEAVRISVAGAVERSGVYTEGCHANAAAMLNSLQPNRPPTTARRHVQLARRLAQMPHVRHAFEAGQITGEHAALLGECLHPRFKGQFAEFEAEMVQHGIELGYADFARLVTAWKQFADDRVEDEREAKDHRARELHLARSFNDRGILKGTLAPIARSIVDNELRRLEHKLFIDDWAEASERLGEGNVTQDDLGRDPAQRRHDALVWMAMRSAQGRAAAGSSEPIIPEPIIPEPIIPEPIIPEPIIYVHTTAADVTAALERDAGIPGPNVDYQRSMCELDDGTPVSKRMLVRWLIQGKVRRLVFDPEGQVIDAGRQARWFSPLQRKLIAARDRVCTCGCGLPARFCDIDHVIEWRDGGRTDLANGHARCPASHRTKTNRRNQQERA